MRNAFERNFSGQVAEDLRYQLVIMCRAYLYEHRDRNGAGACQ